MSTAKEMPKGHGRKAPSGQRSTKMTTLALDDSDDVFGINNTEAPRPRTRTKERTVFYRTLDVNEEAAQKIYTDQPGRFPKKSSRGNQYIMVLTEVDSDAILVEPMKNRTAGEMIRAYQVLIDRLNSVGIFPKLHILDNECSAELKTVIKNNNMTFQLVPPHDHRRNIAEKAIQTFKDHFISILCGADEMFPLHLWDRLLRQAEHTLNMLRPSRMTTTIPTAKPAKSKESPVYTPGISAVSPPDKEQPAILHPFAIPDNICLYFFSITFGIAI